MALYPKTKKKKESKKKSNRKLKSSKDTLQPGARGESKSNCKPKC